MKLHKRTRTHQHPIHPTNPPHPPPPIGGASIVSYRRTPAMLGPRRPPRPPPPPPHPPPLPGPPLPKGPSYLPAWKSSAAAGCPARMQFQSHGNLWGGGGGAQGEVVHARAKHPTSACASLTQSHPPVPSPVLNTARRCADGVSARGTKGHFFCEIAFASVAANRGGRSGLYNAHAGVPRSCSGRSNRSC
jgi:hypothetical protein